MSYKEIQTGAIDYAVNQFQGNNSGNAPVLLMLGGFKFSLNTAVFQEMRRLTSWRWPAQERMGQRDALQNTGYGDDTITLPGVIYGDFKGGPYQLDDLRAIGDAIKPVRLISADGQILGLWVVLSVEETASNFKQDGTPSKQEFNVSIKKFSDGT
jgi:phage protein U